MKKYLILVVLLFSISNSQTTWSEEEANLRKNIPLSFRQVNSFNHEDFSFQFFELTTKPIENDLDYLEIRFLIYCMQGMERIEESIAICNMYDVVGKNYESDIKPIFYDCFSQCELIEEEVEEITSIEISSSELVAGLPLDKNLLNPLLVDEAIAEGKLLNADRIDSNVSLAEIKEINFDTVQDDGIFYMKVNVNIGPSISEGQTFNIQLTYPNGIIIKFTIIRYEGTVLDMKCEIKGNIEGKIENQQLIFEQTLIMSNGMELFVLPGFKTAITTNGANLSKEEEVEEEMSSEKEEIALTTWSEEEANLRKIFHFLLDK